ncbi:MAG: hypothetical protein CVU05_14005, partial [Bacteroidetes bacterium HGW-Bacteroidetes-21]
QTFSGIETQLSTSQNVFPNPTTGNVTVPGFSGIAEIFSIDGQLLQSSFANETVNLNNLPAGTYILHCDKIRTLIVKM